MRTSNTRSLIRILDGSSVRLSSPPASSACWPTAVAAFACKPPIPTAANQSPGFKAWHLTSEPWCFVIDRKGVITAALGPGPVVAPQIEEELKRVLS